MDRLSRFGNLVSREEYGDEFNVGTASGRVERDRAPERALGCRQLAPVPVECPEDRYVDRIGILLDDLSQPFDELTAIGRLTVMGVEVRDLDAKPLVLGESLAMGICPGQERTALIVTGARGVVGQLPERHRERRVERHRVAQ